MKSKKYRIINKRRFYLFITFILTIMTVIIFSIFNSLNAHSSSLITPFREVTVMEGDTLWHIAKNNLPHTNYDIRKLIYDIKEMNQMETASIYPGDIIKVPLIAESNTEN